MAKNHLLTTPISQLYFSHQFEWQCHEMGFYKLEDILILTPAEIMAKPGFTYSWLGELSDFLTKHDLLHLLQPIPGKRFD